MDQYPLNIKELLGKLNTVFKSVYVSNDDTNILKNIQI